MKTFFNKIIATVGPACKNEDALKSMIESSVTGFRIDFTDYNHDEVLNIVKKLRKVESETKKKIIIIADLSGRCFYVEDGIKHFNRNQVVKFTKKKNKNLDKEQITLSPEIFEYLKEGAEVTLNQGAIRSKIVSVYDDHVEAIMLDSGGVKKGNEVNVLNANIKAITQKDKKDAKYAISIGMDVILLSCVQNENDIIEMRRTIGEETFIMAKIETKNAVLNAKSIVKEADGIIVARGGLSAEIPIYKLPIVQRKVIDLCYQYKTPFILGNHFLSSMIENDYPQKSEIFEISSAVMLGVDNLMLCNETAKGKNPMLAVKTIAETLHCNRDHSLVISNKSDDYFLNSIINMQKHYNTKCIIVLGSDVKFCIDISFARMKSKVFVVSKNNRRLSLLCCIMYGIHMINDDGKNIEDHLNYICDMCDTKKSDIIIVDCKLQSVQIRKDL